MLTLYGTARSGSAAVEAALTLAGQPFTAVDAASWQPGAGRDALLKVNPLGQIPTLVLDDGQVLTESAAILVHLGLAAAPGVLLPAEAGARAQALRGLVYIAANCYAAISVIDYPERWCEPCDDAMKERIRAGTRARLRHHWSLFADQIGALFASGEPQALALLAAVVSRWSGARDWLKAERPGFFAQLQAVDRHPAVVAVFQRHWP